MSRSLIYAAALALVVCAAVATAKPSPPGFTFDQWLATHPRDYAKGSAEYHMRRGLFMARAADVEAHNANPAR